MAGIVDDNSGTTGIRSCYDNPGNDGISSSSSSTIITCDPTHDYKTDSKDYKDDHTRAHSRT